MPDTILEVARARYVDGLQRAHPVVDEQLSDVDLLLDALLEGEAEAPRATSGPPVAASPLDAARADYLARLRERGRGLDEQVLDLAQACTHLFAPALGLTG